jgi:hypothetical protein
MSEPLSTGADQLTIADSFPAVADTPLGVSGTLAGVTAEEADEGGELPRLFTAWTVKVTVIPFVSPVRLAVKTFPTVIAAPVEGVTM